MGGMIAQEFALRHPQRVRALVLGCTGSGGSGQISLDSDHRASAYELSSISDEERARRLAVAGFSQQFLRAHPDMIDYLIEPGESAPSTSPPSPGAVKHWKPTIPPIGWEQSVLLRL